MTQNRVQPWKLVWRRPTRSSHPLIRRLSSNWSKDSEPRHCTKRLRWRNQRKWQTWVGKQKQAPHPWVTPHPIGMDIMDLCNQTIFIQDTLGNIQVDSGWQVLCNMLCSTLLHGTILMLPPDQQAKKHCLSADMNPCSFRGRKVTRGKVSTPPSLTAIAENMDQPWMSHQSHHIIISSIPTAIWLPPTTGIPSMCQAADDSQKLQPSHRPISYSAWGKCHQQNPADAACEVLAPHTLHVWNISLDI